MNKRITFLFFAVLATLSITNVKRYAFRSTLLLMTIFFASLSMAQNTWKGGTSGSWSTATNWSANAVPTSTDIVTFNGSNINGSNGTGNITVTGVPTSSVGRLVLANSANVSLQPTTGSGNQVLTVGNTTTSDNDIDIPSGCQLTIASNSFPSFPITNFTGGDSTKISNALTLQMVSTNTPKASIAGNLTIQRNATFTLPSVPTLLTTTATSFSAGAYVYFNQNLYIVSVAGTATSATVPSATFGTGTAGGGGVAKLTYIGSVVTGSISTTAANNTYGAFANIYNAANGVTTVTSTGTIENQSSSIANVNSSRLIFQDGANYIYNRADANSNVPSATDMSGVNFTITGIVCSSAQFTPVVSFPATIKSLIWNTPDITGLAASRFQVFSSGTSLTINGNASFTNGATTNNLGASGTTLATVIINGNLTVTSCNFYTGRGDMNWTVTGNLTLNSGSLNVLDGLYNVSSPAVISNLTVNGSLFINGTSTMRLNNLSTASASTANLNVKGNFTKASTSFFTTSATSLQVGNLVMNGTLAQTLDASGGFTNSPNLTINNSAGVTLGSNVSLQNSSILTLTSGKLALSSYTLTLGSTASISPSTPTSASYIDASGTGLFIRQSVPSTGNTVFPIGTATSYAPLIFTGGTLGRDITVGVKNSFTPTVPYPLKVVNLQWSIQASAATQPTVTFQYNTVDQGSGYTSSGAVLGTYASGAYSETALTSVSGTNPFTSAMSVTLPATTTNLYGIGNPNSFLVQLGIPTAPSAVAGLASATVSFTAPTNTTGITGYRVVSTPGSFTATGTSPITVTGLNSGTAYTFTVQATDGTFFGTASSASNSVTPTGNYTWNGSTSSDYQISTNWTPNRVTPGTGDVLTFSSNATVINVPTQTISQLLLSGSSTSVSLQAATAALRTLTIGFGSPAGTDLDIPTGCTLTLATGGASNDSLSIAFTGTATTASIAGSLTINPSSTSKYGNTYTATNSTTTVSGTITNTGAITSTATNLVFATGGTYIHNRPDGGVTQSFPIADFTNANVKVQALAHASSSTSTQFNNFPSAMASLEWNTPSVTGSAGSRWSIVSGSTSLTITGNVSIIQGASNSGIGFNNSTVTSVNIGGNLTVTTASLYLSRGTMDWTVTGDFILNNNSTFNVINNFYNGKGSVTSTMTVGNYIQNGGTFTLNGISTDTVGSSIGKLVVKGNFNKTAGTFTTGTTTSASLTASGPQLGILEFNGASAQTFTLTGGFFNSPNLTINNSAGVTLGSDVSLLNSSVLTLTSGKLALSTYTLTLGSTASISPTTPTSTSYIDASGGGLLIRQAVPSSGSTVFPIGTSASYAPLIFTGGTAGANITVGVKSSFTNAVVVPNNVVNLQWSIQASAATKPTVTFQYNSANRGSGYSSVGAVLGTYESGAYSEDALSSVSGTDPFTTSVAFTTDLPTVAASLYGIGNVGSFVLQLGKPTNVVAVAGNASATVSFSYPAITTGITGYRVVSNPGGFNASGNTSPITVTGLVGGTSYTFTVQATDGTDFGSASSASASVTPTGNFTWTGTTSSDYQVSTNWSPSRITPGLLDVLTFSSNATVTNVPTQTIGRLVLSGSSTVVSLQPATGNGNRTLTVGNSNTSDDDIQIPTGCELIIATNSYGTFVLPSTYGGGANDKDKISNALTLQLAASNSPKANIFGKLTIQRNATYSLPAAPSLFATNTPYAVGTYVYRNQNLYAVTTAGTPTTNPSSTTFGGTLTSGGAVLTYIGSVLSGSITSSAQYGVFANTYNVGGGVTTVASDATIENQSASIAGTPSISNLVFNSGANYIYNRADGNTNLPTGTDMTGVNITVKGIISSYFLANITLPPVSASLIWNTPGITATGASRFVVPSGTSLKVNGNALITQGEDTTTFIMANGSLLNSIEIGGNFTIDKVTLPLTRGTMNWTVGGTLTMSSACFLSVIDNFYTGKPNVTSTLTVRNFTQNGGTFTLNGISRDSIGSSVGKLVVTGNFNSIAGIFTTSSSISTSTSSPGAQVGTLEFNGTTPQTISGSVILPGTTIINSTGGVSVTGALGISGILSLQAGTLTTNGNVTLKSTATSNGVLGPVGTGTISGNVVVERFIPMSLRAYRDISPGVTSSTSIFANWQENGASPTGYGTYITGAVGSSAGDSAGLDYSYSGSRSLYQYVNGTWSAVTNTRTPTLSYDKPYRILIRGDRTFNIFTTPQGGGDPRNGPGPMQSPTVLRGTGTLFTGTYSPSLNPTVGKFTMIANPYVCPIDWNSITKTNIGTSFWYLDPTIGNANKYVVFNSTLGSTNNPFYSDSTSVSGSQVNQYIQPGQAFFVRTESASPSLTIQETHKAASTSKRAVFDVAEPVSKIAIGLLKQSTTSTAYRNMDGAVVAFGNSFSNGLGDEDSRSLKSANDNLSIVSNNDSLSIEGRQPVTEKDTIALLATGLDKTLGYRLRIDASNYAGNGVVPYLYDSYKNTVTALDVTKVNTIDFAVDANAASSGQRFSLVFKPTVLAVNSIVVAAKATASGVQVNWNTVGEHGAISYEVERSSNGISFSKQSTVAAKNTATASYSYTDGKPASGDNYYRIKAIGTTGVNYSQVLLVKVGGITPSLVSVYPNPIVGSQLNVAFSNVAAGSYQVSLHNSVGQQVFAGAVKHAGGTANVAVNLGHYLPAGSYEVAISDAAGKVVYHTQLAATKK